LEKHLGHGFPQKHCVDAAPEKAVAGLCIECGSACDL
jgi:hypothetical protein